MKVRKARRKRYSDFDGDSTKVKIKNKIKRLFYKIVAIDEKIRRMSMIGFLTLFFGIFFVGLWIIAIKHNQLFYFDKDQAGLIVEAWKNKKVVMDIMLTLMICLDMFFMLALRRHIYPQGGMSN